MPLTVSRLLVSLAVATVVMVGATGCTTEGGVPAPTGSSTPSGSPEATPTEQPDASTGTPVDLDCDELITPQAIYDYNPNLALEADYAPTAGTDAETIVARGGVACGWVNATSGNVLRVAVANLPTHELDARKNTLVTESNSVPTYEVEGYFQMAGIGGEAEAFAGPYWIVVTADFFVEPGDAAPIVEAARAALGE